MCNGGVVHCLTSPWLRLLTSTKARLLLFLRSWQSRTRECIRCDSWRVQEIPRWPKIHAAFEELQ
eukprot:6463976-Pyramimonas_sp.AAC.1